MAGNDKGYTLHLTEQANADIWREIDFLNAEREGLGEKFFDDLQKSINRILDDPLMYAETIHFIRRGLLKKFKFNIFYAVDSVNNEVEVIAILHQKQDPRIILERLNLEF